MTLNYSDAVGLKITMRTSWYGAERVVATSNYEFNNWPLIDLDLNTERSTPYQRHLVDLIQMEALGQQIHLNYQLHRREEHILNTQMKRTELSQLNTEIIKEHGNNSRRNKTCC